MTEKLITSLHSVFNEKHIDQHEFNYEKLQQFIQNINSYMYTHRTIDKNVHDTTQIIHALKSGLKVVASDKIEYLQEQIIALVLGHNGDGIQELRASKVSIDAVRHDDLSTRLYHDFVREQNAREKVYAELLEKIQRVVNVDDYGADPTGNKDSTKAFEKALGTGNVQLTMSSGTYLTTGFKLPNNTRIVGQGENLTTIKFMDSTPAANIGITNLKMNGKAKNIVLENFGFDGNKFRQDSTLKPVGGSRSSNIRLAGVTNGYIYNVKSFNALLHCIDVTFASDDYYYEGDGNRVPTSLESRYIHIDNCETYGNGDDGITTHHSRYITISNNYCHDSTPGGNRNGIEIDDASQFVFLSDNKTEKNFAGVEVKGHAPVSSARGIFINNHLSIEDTRSYNIRHIGHHRPKTDAKSKTAYDVVMNNCMSLRPKFNGVYPGSTPRALVISAYRNVIVNNFTAIGDSDFSKLEGNKVDTNMPAIAIQFMAENVILNGINVTGFKDASADIKFFGGDNRGKRFVLSNFNIYNSSVKRGVASGGGIYDLKISNGNLKGRGAGVGIELYNNTTDIFGVSADGYKNAAIIAGEKYAKVPTVLKGGFSGGSTGSAAISEASAVIASTGGCKAYSARSYVIGSGDNSKAYGSRSSIQNSLNCQTNPGGHTQMVMNSRGVKAPGNYHIVGGYGTNNKPSTSNIKFDIDVYSGNLALAGKLTQNSADIAELFESQSGHAIDLGTIVTLDGEKIKKAQPNDKPIGVISGTAALIANDKLFHHKDRYLKNEYGVTLTEHTKVSYFDDSGNEHFEWRDVPIENPDYDDDIEYIARSERPEWNVVGLVGQIYTNVGEDVVVGDFINGRAGIGYKDNVNGSGRVMSITTKYTKNRGHAIALVLWGVN